MSERYQDFAYSEGESSLPAIKKEGTNAALSADEIWAQTKNQVERGGGGIGINGLDNFSAEQLAMAQGILTGQVTPKVIMESDGKPSRQELDRKMTENLMTKSIEAQLKGDTTEAKKYDDLLAAHQARIDALGSN